MVITRIINAITKYGVNTKQTKNKIYIVSLSELDTKWKTT